MPFCRRIINHIVDFVPITGLTEFNPFDLELRGSSDIQLGYPTLHGLSQCDVKSNLFLVCRINPFGRIESVSCSSRLLASGSKPIRQLRSKRNHSKC